MINKINLLGALSFYTCVGDAPMNNQSMPNEKKDRGTTPKNNPMDEKIEAVNGMDEIITVITNAPTDFAMLSKPDGTIVAINTTGAKTLGQNPDNLVGICIFELLADSCSQLKKTHFEQTAQTRQPVRFEGRLADKSFHHSIYPVFNQHGRVEYLTLFSHDITHQKHTEQGLREREKELKTKAKQLEEINTTLKVLLKEREKDKNEIEENVLSNITELVLPYLEKLKSSKLDGSQKTFLEILESNLKEIISPFSRKLSLEYPKFTPTEIQVANLIKQGCTSKRMAEMMNISPRTVETHRKNIRRKVGLNQKKANLRSYLLSM